jgi:hypothetical protein
LSDFLLTDVAEVIRSKNAGPYELTLDIILTREEDYAFLKEGDFFTKELFAELYGVAADAVLSVTHFDPACAVKATLVRTHVSGDPGDSDIYGAQQHAPLLALRVPRRGGQ